MFAWPAPGQGSSIKSFGVNLSSPVFRLSSDIRVDGTPAGEGNINGSRTANPRGNHMLVSLVKPVRMKIICTVHCGFHSIIASSLSYPPISIHI